MGYEKDPNARGPRNYVYSKATTKDKVPDDHCRTCGQIVRFTTWDGRLMAIDPLTLDRHPCVDA